MLIMAKGDVIATNASNANKTKILYVKTVLPNQSESQIFTEILPLAADVPD